MGEWITPKTNWYSTDYYNLEDAQRIAGNICYLYEMYGEIYPRGTYTCLLPIRYYREEEVLIELNVMLTPFVYVPENPCYPPSSYTRDLTYWLYMDSVNLHRLAMMKAMSADSEPREYHNVPVGLVNDRVYPDPEIVYFDGYAIKCPAHYNRRYNYSYLAMLFETEDSYQGDYINKIPICLKENRQGTADWRRLYDFKLDYEKLYNKPFYSHYALNNIERVTQEVYEKFTEYLGG